MSYRYENIRELLTKGFEPIELRAICDKYEFEDFCDELTGNESKLLLVDKLVHFARRGGPSRVAQFLNWAKERNIGMWEQCGPYEVHELHNVNIIKLLFLTANPISIHCLNVNKEIDEIKQVLQAADLEKRFDINIEWNVTKEELQNHLQRHRPNILHFSGHGAAKTQEIIFQDIVGNSDPVPKVPLAKSFSLLDDLWCVVLNACHTEQQAIAIAQHIDYVIGMSGLIRDCSAINFSKEFYQALGNGYEVPSAFQWACTGIELKSLPDEDKPKLFSKGKAQPDVCP